MSLKSMPCDRRSCGMLPNCHATKHKHIPAHATRWAQRLPTSTAPNPNAKIPCQSPLPVVTSIEVILINPNLQDLPQLPPTPPAHQKIAQPSPYQALHILHSALLHACHVTERVPSTVHRRRCHVHAGQKHVVHRHGQHLSELLHFCTGGT